jgi:hypothetical protein
MAPAGRKSIEGMFRWRNEERESSAAIGQQATVPFEHMLCWVGADDDTALSR